MRWRLSVLALLVVGTTAFAAMVDRPPAAQPQAICELPGTISCVTDAECSGFGAVCDQVSATCVCAAAIDGGAGDGGNGDAGNGDAGNGDGGGGGGGTGGGGGSTGGTGPSVGGGASSPARTGCSFVPGSAR